MISSFSVKYFGILILTCHAAILPLMVINGTSVALLERSHLGESDLLEAENFYKVHSAWGTKGPGL